MHQLVEPNGLEAYNQHVPQLLVRTFSKTKKHAIAYCVPVGPTSPNTGANTGKDSNDDNNRNVLIGVLVPVIFILLVVVTLLTIGIIIVVKR